MKKKIVGLLILLFVYVAAFGVGLGFFWLFKDRLHIILNLFVCDVIATVFVWLVGIPLKSASVYDPYWSVQTPVIMLSLMIGKNSFTAGGVVFLIVVLLWSIRLTGNFVHAFNDISYIDWRYRKIKEKTGRAFQLVSLVGIHLIPTVVVYCASVPAYYYILSRMSFSPLNLIGWAIMLAAISFELFADINMHKFQRERSGRQEIIHTGLWKYSRHSNYFGEILFWYGVAAAYIISDFSAVYLICGAILNTALFLFISIPLAENHMKEYKAGFAEYKKRTRMLLPIKKPLFKKDRQRPDKNIDLEAI